MESKLLRRKISNKNVKFQQETKNKKMALNKNSSSNNTQNSKAWHSVRRASQSTQQPSLAIEDSVDLGAVCETPVTAKTPIREAFENIGNYSKSSTSQKKASSSSSQNARKQQEEESRKDDDDGEMEFNFSDLEEDEDKSGKKQEEQFERSPVFYSSESLQQKTPNQRKPINQHRSKHLRRKKMKKNKQNNHPVVVNNVLLMTILNISHQMRTNMKRKRKAIL